MRAMNFCPWALGRGKGSSLDASRASPAPQPLHEYVENACDRAWDVRDCGSSLRCCFYRHYQMRPEKVP